MNKLLSLIHFFSLTKTETQAYGVLCTFCSAQTVSPKRRIGLCVKEAESEKASTKKVVLAIGIAFDA